MMEKLLTPQETAKVLQVSVATLRDWRRKGKGPAASKISGRTIRYSETVIKDWLESVRRTQPAESWR